MSVRPLSQANAQRGFEGRLRFGVKPALLMIDFVKAYTIAESPLYAGVEATRVACIDLLTLCRSCAVPVIHTNVAYQRGGADGGVFFRKAPALKCFEAGAPSELSEFAVGLEPRNEELVITKQYASAFFGTSLVSTLNALRIDTVLIAGVSTSGCIRASAVDCCQYGFIPIVVREAVGDRAQDVHDANLFDLQTKYAEVVAMDGVQAYLASLCRTPGKAEASER